MKAGWGEPSRTQGATGDGLCGQPEGVMGAGAGGTVQVGFDEGGVQGLCPWECRVMPAGAPWGRGALLPLSTDQNPEASERKPLSQQHCPPRRPCPCTPPCLCSCCSHSPRSTVSRTVCLAHCSGLSKAALLQEAFPEHPDQYRSPYGSHGPRLLSVSVASLLEGRATCGISLDPRTHLSQLMALPPPVAISAGEGVPLS